jgi:hypothetical protein
MIARHIVRQSLVLLVLAAVSATLDGAPAGKAPALPDRLSDAEFWKLVTDISEPGGYFRITDNYTSNEPEIGRLFTMLREAGVKGGVYLGVGPEQNLTYIAAVRPAMAFVVDIRRQAVMQHLMYKAIFELGADRADFIALLFSKKRPEGLTAASPIQQIWNAFQPVETDTALAARTYARLVELLVRTHNFAFTDEESGMLSSVFQAFTAYGPAISTRGPAGGPVGGNRSTFADLTGWSLDDSGEPQSFLSTDEHYQIVKALHARNLIVPVSGDFGGTKALRAIGAYLHKQGGTVSAYYLSNVEQYLFMDGKAQAFYANVATMPLGEASVFVRPYSLRRGGGPVASLCGIRPFLAAVAAGRVYSNNDALACVR